MKTLHRVLFLLMLSICLSCTDEVPPTASVVTGFNALPNPYSSQANFLTVGLSLTNQADVQIELVGSPASASMLFSAPLGVGSHTLQLPTPTVSPGLYRLQISANDGEPMGLWLLID